MKAKKVKNLRLDPETLAAMTARARRARAEFVHNAIVRLIHKLTPKPTAWLRGAHWG